MPVQTAIMLVRILAYILVSTLLTSAKEEKIVMAHILFRHGDRNPVLSYKTNPYTESDWPQGYGQLTKIGMQQHYELGQFLRKKYINGEPHQLLNSSYDHHEIEIRSTDVDRTLMSAYSNLAGLYPPNGPQIWNEKLLWQPIPVHTVPKAEDNLLHMESKCPKYNQEYKEVLESEEVKKLHEDYREFFAFVANKTEKFDLNINNVWEIHDSIFCERNHNFTLPDWVNQRFYGKSVFDLLEEMNSIQFDLQFNRKNEAKLKGGSLLSKLLEDTKNMVKDREKKKAYIYSAHDDTMSAFLSSMKVFNRISPPYAACAMVDIFQNMTGNETIAHYVIISYRNSSDSEPFKLQVPGCDVKCPLDKFRELVEENAVSDWEKECYVDFTTAIPDYVNIVILASLGILVLILLSTMCLVVIKKKKSYPSYSQI